MRNKIRVMYYEIFDNPVFSSFLVFFLSHSIRSHHFRDHNHVKFNHQGKEEGSFKYSQDLPSNIFRLSKCNTASQWRQFTRPKSWKGRLPVKDQFIPWSLWEFPPIVTCIYEYNHFSLSVYIDGNIIDSPTSHQVEGIPLVRSYFIYYQSNWCPQVGSSKLTSRPGLKLPIWFTGSITVSVVVDGVWRWGSKIASLARSLVWSIYYILVFWPDL